MAIGWADEPGGVPRDEKIAPMDIGARLHFTGGTSLRLEDSREEAAAAIAEARRVGALARLHASDPGDDDPVVVYVIPENVLYIE